MANTATISFNFEAPDGKLTGLGDFDISQTFKGLFEENTMLKEALSERIVEIVRSIKTDEVAENWSETLESAFNFEKGTLKSPTTSRKTPETKNKTASDLEEKYQKFITTDPRYIKFLESFLPDRPFQKFIKGFAPLASTLSQSVDTFKKSSTSIFQKIGDFLSGTTALESNKAPIIATPTPDTSGDTIFDKGSPEVIITDFTGKAIEDLDGIFSDKKLTKLFRGLRKDEDDKGTGFSLAKALLIGAAILAILPRILTKYFGTSPTGTHKTFWADPLLLYFQIMKSRMIAVVEKEGAFGFIEKALAKLFRGIGRLLLWPFIKLDQLIFGGGMAKMVPEVAEKLAGKLTNFFAKIGTWIFDFIKGVLLKIAPIFGESGKAAGTVLKTVGIDALKAGMKIALLRVLKYIPLVGFGLSMIDMVQRFKAGDIVGGLIALLSGIANVASIIPGFGVIGTAISIILDLVNVGRDIKAGGYTKHSTSNANQWLKNSLYPFLKKLPIIGTVINLGEAIYNLLTGQWKKAGKNLQHAGLSVLGLEFIWSDEQITETTAKGMGSAGSWIKDTLYPFLKKAPFIGPVLNLAEAVYYLFTGQWKKVGKSLQHAGLSVLGLEFIWSDEQITETTAKGIGSAGNWLKNTLYPFLKKMPFIGPVLNLAEAVYYLSTGQWKNVAKSLQHAGLSVLGLEFIWSSEKITETTARGMTSAGNWLKNTLYPFLKRIPVIGTVIHLGEAIGHLMRGEWGQAVHSLAAAGLTTFGVGLFFNVEKTISATVEGMTDAWATIKDVWKRGISEFLPTLKKMFFKVTVDPIIGAFTTIKEGFLRIKDEFFKLFSDFWQWIKDIPKNVKAWAKEALPEWMVKKSGTAEVIESTTPAVAVKDTNPIRILPTKNDRAHPLSDGRTVLAERGGVLDQKLDGVIRAINNLGMAMSNNPNSNFSDALLPIITHLKNISQSNDQQLQLLPALARTQRDTVYPSSDTSDRVDQYRRRVRDNLARRI